MRQLPTVWEVAGAARVYVLVYILVVIAYDQM